MSSGSTSAPAPPLTEHDRDEGGRLAPYELEDRSRAHRRQERRPPGERRHAGARTRSDHPDRRTEATRLVRSRRSRASPRCCSLWRRSRSPTWSPPSRPRLARGRQSRRCRRVRPARTNEHRAARAVPEQFVHKRSRPPQAAAEQPIVDPATQQASYNDPGVRPPAGASSQTKAQADDMPPPLEIVHGAPLPGRTGSAAVHRE